MKALVTGSAGFIGRHMVRALEGNAWLVAQCDLVDGGDALELFRTETVRYDLVVHCAFHVGGRAAIDRNRTLLARNLRLDSAMFDWVVRTRQRRVLYFSSSAAYPVYLQTGVLGAPLRESMVGLVAEFAGQPDADYGWAKLTGERMAANAGEAVPVHILRPFSGYSENQSLDYPFPSFVDRAKRRESPFTIWGPGTQVRDWIHVDDLVAGALAIVDADDRQPVNLCTGVGTSMLELAELICEKAGYEPTFAPQPDRPTGVAHRVGDPTRMLKFYEPKVSLEEGVTRALLR